jgi:hypothetical protein
LEDTLDTDLDRILDAGYLDGLATFEVGRLRELRSDCQSVETQLSYLRRMVQGRHDIVAGELARRRAGAEGRDLGELVDQLPSILADRIHAPGPGRLPSAMEPGELRGRLADRLAEITDRVPIEAPGEGAEAELEVAAAELEVLEREVSDYRRKLFERIDALQAEITRRYRDGEAQVDDLLGRG